jgi:hypothetical protein
MTNDQHDKRSWMPVNDGREPTPGLNSVTHYDYEGNQLLHLKPPVPERMPISAEEMDSLMRLLGHLRTKLLWSYCQWAEGVRSGQLSRAELAAKACILFDRLRHQFVDHLTGVLDACPDPIFVEPPQKDDAGPRPD